MSNYSSVKATINANVKQNNNQEITGVILNSVLNEMVTALGDGYQFKGVATTSTNPGSPDARVFYVATPGTYQYFGNQTVPAASTGFFRWDTSWHLDIISTGVADGAVTTSKIANSAVTEAKLASALVAKLFTTGYKYAGIASPSTNPGTPNQDVFYLAGEGTYPNFGNAVIDVGHIGVLSYHSSTWSSSSVQVMQIVNDLTTGGAEKALSAEQGKKLNDKITSMAMRVDGSTLIIGEETPDSYVADGLIFHLDGIDKGVNQDAWTDLVGGKVFANTNCISRDNCFEFPSDAWAYLTSSDVISQSGATGTIEIVYDGNLSGANRFLFYPNSSGALMVSFASSLNGFVMRAGVNAPVWLPKYMTGKSRLSLSNTLAMQNLERLVQSGSNYFADLSSSAYIGRRSTSTSSQAFVGKIYSIRIYDRILTYNEMVQNQNYDALRFGL